MGRKAKLKKERKKQPQNIDNYAKDSNQFVKHLERQGYALKKPKMAPDMPDEKIEPQV
ncbi:MAG: hypothetical protein QNJ37_13015 [Crocosphaera sp.]|nr:hypothetical protein [Crocosphaera sp.]